MDTNGVLSAVFDEANQQLRVTVVTGTPGPVDGTPDENGAWAGAYDPAARALKVVMV